VVDERGDEVPVVAVRCDLVVESKAVVVNDKPEPVRALATDVGDRDVLVVVERLREAGDFLVEECHCALLLVDGFRRRGARGISDVARETGEAGVEDKERSSTGAALTPKRRALDEKRPSTGGCRH
jgi:hypothetical protein